MCNQSEEGVGGRGWGNVDGQDDASTYHHRTVCKHQWQKRRLGKLLWNKSVPSQNSMFQAQWTPRISCLRLTSWKDSGIPSWSRFGSFVSRFHFHLSSISALCRLHFGGAHLHCHWTYEIWQSTRISPGIYPPKFLRPQQTILTYTFSQGKGKLLKLPQLIDMSAQVNLRYHHYPIHHSHLYHQHHRRW